MSVQCKWCGSTNLISRSPKYQCKDCSRYTSMSEAEHASTFEFTEDKIRETATIKTSLPRIMSDDDLISFLNIDLNEWAIEKVIYGKSEAYRKDREVEWEVSDGKANGYVHDSGKILVEPLFTVKVFLVRKTKEIQAKSVINDLLEDIKKHSPKRERKAYKIDESSLLYEIAMPDLQLGRLVLSDEAGIESSPDLTIERADKVMTELIERIKGMNVGLIVFPVGNDFFDSNTAEMMTVHGTPQRDDVRWQRTFKLGREFIVRTVDELAKIAPVHILIIPGNHDEEKIFYLGDVLDAWYHNDENVTVDNRPIKRKYFFFGTNLIGLTHGYYEKPEKLAALMAVEVPDLWAKSTYREWHLGDKHHKKDMIFKTDQMDNGVVVRILRSLATPSVWEFDKGFVGGAQAAEGFLWHPTKGVIAQFTAVV